MAASETIAFTVTTALNVVSILVLSVTGWAVWKQAKAAEKLTEATKLQIQASETAAAAAEEQVKTVKRQIVESLRPVLDVRHIGGSGADIELTNVGSGIALDVWWSYGRLGDNRVLKERIGFGIMPRGAIEKVFLDISRAQNKGLLFVYQSVAGAVSATSVIWGVDETIVKYHGDVSESVPFFLEA